MTSEANEPSFYFGIYRWYIVTANADGSIPPNARVVCRIGEHTSDDLLTQLIAQANATKRLLDDAKR